MVIFDQLSWMSAITRNGYPGPAIQDRELQWKVMWVWSVGCVCALHAYMHVHMCTHTKMLNMLIYVLIMLAICNFLTCIFSMFSMCVPHLCGVYEWGVASHVVFLSFGAKKIQLLCFCQAPGKNVPVFTLNPNRPCWNWPLISILSSQPIYGPFKSDSKWKQKWQIWLWHQFCHRTINPKKFWNVPWDAPMCSSTNHQTSEVSSS